MLTGAIMPEPERKEIPYLNQHEETKNDTYR